MRVFTDIAPFYDLVKSHRDYEAEAGSVRGLVQRYAPRAKTVLEVACGTGTLLALLPEYDRVGVDVSEPMLAVAREKLGDQVTLVHGRMRDFRLPGPGADAPLLADVLLLLDGAIGYAGPSELDPTFATFARHLVSGGLLVVEPWYTPQDWEPRKVRVAHHRGDGVTVVRVAYGHPGGSIDFHTTIGTDEGLRTFEEHYDFTLHRADEVKAAIRAAGFVDVREETAPPFKRGLWVARKP
ncbi:class I SAM-dependent DNA methyltransferase [Streptomyces sp. NPDC004726]